MFERMLVPPDSQQSYFLFGPRGTGKTNWVKSFYKNALYLDLLESGLYTNLLARPSLLEELIPPHFSDWIVIDEIQRVPELLNEIHRLIESKHLRFILTGSSARGLRKQGANLLGGRARMERMHPLTAIELGDTFDLKKALQSGLMPVIWNRNEDARLYLEGYLGVYLQQEVAQEGIVRQLGDFARFLKIASLSQGQPINLSNISREVGLPRDRVAGYFQIVEDLLIAIHIPPFTRRSQRRLIMHPKFYFFDAGLFRAIRPLGPLDSDAEIDGAGLETLLLQNIRAINDNLHLHYDIHFWRTASGLEVDFILYGPNGLHAIEVKRSRTIGKHDLTALEAFKKEYPEAICWMVFGGDRNQYFDSITAVPFQDFLFSLREILPAKKG
ncbi:MAG: AAA family ATPase [Parachlamydiales bacterium]|nr:AAA family ATPase [Parachlamydiales bacterium]